MKQSNLAGISLCLIGLILCIFPYSIWKITEKWKSNNTSNPSIKYITVLRVLGGVFMSIGIFLTLGIVR